MQRKINIVKLASYFLIGLGVLFLALYFLLGWTSNFIWPIVIIMLGAVFFILTGTLKKDWIWADLLYIPATLMLFFGVIFLINVLTNDWNAWAYAWMLIIAGLGVGVLLADRRYQWRKEIRQAAVGTIIASITLAILFGIIAGGRFFIVMISLLLVWGGLSLQWLHPKLALPEGILKRLHREGIQTENPGVTPLSHDALVEPLSTRELEVLNLIDQGLTNPEIAERLSLATSTVKTHINNIYGKLAVQTRVQAVNRAKELGLLRQ
jgi:DNA-binding CsgD family transcriptional regulator